MKRRTPIFFLKKEKKLNNWKEKSQQNSCLKAHMEAEHNQPRQAANALTLSIYFLPEVLCGKVVRWTCDAVDRNDPTTKPVKEAAGWKRVLRETGAWVAADVPSNVQTLFLKSSGAPWLAAHQPCVLFMRIKKYALVHRRKYIFHRKLTSISSWQYNSVNGGPWQVHF